MRPTKMALNRELCFSVLKTIHDFQNCKQWMASYTLIFCTFSIPDIVGAKYFSTLTLYFQWCSKNISYFVSSLVYFPHQNLACLDCMIHPLDYHPKVCSQYRFVVVESAQIVLWDDSRTTRPVDNSARSGQLGLQRTTRPIQSGQLGLYIKILFALFVVLYVDVFFMPSLCQLHRSVGYLEGFPMCDNRITENDRCVIKIIGIHCMPLAWKVCRGHLVFGSSVCLSVSPSIIPSQFGWSYSNQTWTVRSSKGCSYFTDITCPWGWVKM